MADDKLFQAEYVGSGTFMISKPKRKKIKARQSQIGIRAAVRASSLREQRIRERSLQISNLTSPESTAIPRL